MSAGEAGTSAGSPVRAPLGDDAVFVTLVRGRVEMEAARLLIASLRRFGGEMGAAPVWVYEAASGDEADPGRGEAAPASGVTAIPLEVPPTLAAWPYGAKVLACARAEARAQASTRSLVWLDPECLVVRPPLAFGLGDVADVAVRPVHLRGVGLTPGGPPDAFWGGVYDALGVEDVELTVESFIEGERLRAFFNSHGFAVRPALGLCGRWLDALLGLVGDAAFEEAACSDEPHRVFLFQAVFSALVATSVARTRLRVLPPGYAYPYNLHGRVPESRRAAALDDLVSFAWEGRSLRPATVTDVAIREPLRSWLEGMLGDGGPADTGRASAASG